MRAVRRRSRLDAEIYDGESFMAFPLAGSLRLDARRFDHPAPLVCVLHNKLTEIAGRDCECRDAKFGKPLTDPRIGKPCYDCSAKLFNNFSGRVPRGTDPDPEITLIAWH